MKGLTKFFLIISLTPLIFIFAISILNLDKSTKLKLLTWTTPDSKIGTYTAISGLLGFTYSFAGIKLLSLQRISFTYKDKYSNYKNYDNNVIEENDYNPNNEDNFNNNEAESIIERDLRDPSPTVSVPFKVISVKSKKNTDYDIDTTKNKSTTNFSNDFIKTQNNEESNIDDWSKPIKDEWLY